MIVTEHFIRAIVDTIPSVQINPDLLAKPKFHWGDDLELNKYIQLKKDDSYPLIWLLPTPDGYKGSLGQEVIKECNFIIATRETRTELFNDQRYINAFDLVLQPLTENLIHGLTVSNITDKVDVSYEIQKIPNYNVKTRENGTIDLWDAMSLTIEIRFKSKLTCLKPINYGE